MALAGGVDEGVQRRQRAAVHEQRAGGLHRGAGLQRARQRRGGQARVVPRLARLLLGIGQGGPGLQALQLGDDASAQHAVGRVGVLAHPRQGALAQLGRARRQLRAEVALGQQRLLAQGGSAGVGLGLLGHGVQFAAHGITQAADVQGPQQREVGRGAVPLALQAQAGGQLRHLPHGAGQRRRQQADGVRQRLARRIQADVGVGRRAQRGAGDGHRRPAQPLHGLAAQAGAFHLARGGRQPVGAGEQQLLGLRVAQGLGRRAGLGLDGGRGQAQGQQRRRSM